MKENDSTLIYDNSINSSFQAVYDAVEEIMQIFFSKWEWIGTSKLFKLSFILRELLNNAVEHGNRFDQKKKVQCRITLEREFLVLEVTDEGKGIESYPQSFDQEDADTLLRERNRGLELLLEMAFQVSIIGSQVKVLLALNEEE